jgi:hypothetical protein
LETLERGDLHIPELEIKDNGMLTAEGTILRTRLYGRGRLMLLRRKGVVRDEQFSNTLGFPAYELHVQYGFLSRKKLTASENSYLGRVTIL